MFRVRDFAGAHTCVNSTDGERQSEEERARMRSPFCGAIVLLDQEPLRQAVAADCTSAMARLERVRAGWFHFERKDKPAFARWRAREFGVAPQHSA